MKAALVVSIHDVSPRTVDMTEKMLQELAECGVARTSLLVIPDHHRHGHFLDDPAFCAWLREKTALGHEAIIHGYFHRRSRREDESLAGKLTTRVYTADEGEFFDISEEEAFDSVTKAQEEFATLGLNPSGFIAPAWLLSEEGETALKRAEIHYTTRLTHVRNLRTGETFPSQSMVYSVRSGWRRVVSLGWNAWLHRRLGSNPLLRIGIHPPDYKYPRIWKQILHYAGMEARDRIPMTYAEWVQHRLP
jgi:uncharacterized protein